MTKYKILLFDLDDTLVNNLENVRHAYTKMVESQGEKYTDKGFQKWYDLDVQYWVDFHDKKIVVPDQYQKSEELFTQYVRSLRYYLYFNGRITMEQALEINDLYLSSLKEIVIPIKGAYETLEYLKNKYRIVIATNGPTVAVESKLTKINCSDFISDVFSADMTKQKITKPNKNYFEELKSYLNFYKTEQMLIIGDSLHSDIQGGMNSGIDSCWFNKDQEELTSNHQPTMVINDLIELKRIL